MKGPSERLKYDLHRVWECPVCKRRERTTGAVAFRHCACQMKQMDGRAVVMKLVVDGVQRVGPAVVITHEPVISSDADRNSSHNAADGVSTEGQQASDNSPS
jgi:hypothetical protein